MINLNIIFIGIILVLIVFIIIKNIKTIVNIILQSKMDFISVSNEIHVFALTILIENILEKMVNSSKDEHGGRIALREISDKSDPIYTGLVVSVIGNMSSHLKNKFYTFYKYTKDDSVLINQISSIIDAYNYNLHQRLKKFEEEIRNANKIAVQNQKTPIDGVEYSFGLLVESIVNDHKLLQRINRGE